MLMRSKLFVPGSRPELFDKAVQSAADAISIDIEDAVDEARKAEARASVAEWLQGLNDDRPRARIIVRVNAHTTAHFAADLDAILPCGVDLLNLPMLNDAAELCAAVAAIEDAERRLGVSGKVPLLVNIETAQALANAASIAAAHERVVGLQLGFGDLLEPLGIVRNNPAAIQQIQLMVRLATGASGRWAYDSAFANIADGDGYRLEAETSRKLGFLGKSCIHPSQIALANEAFRPGEAEIEHSRRVVAAAVEAKAKGVGAFTVDGKMIDAPFIRRAEAILALARDLAPSGK